MKSSMRFGCGDNAVIDGAGPPCKLQRMKRPTPGWLLLVLALKHSLNAEAIAALGGESAKIQADVTRLIEDMNASISSANEFLRQMPKSGQ